MIWLIFGAPGSGKGTQSSLMEKKLGFKHLSTGDMFRYHLKNETEIGKKAKSFMNAGNLVPDELVTDMVKTEFSKDIGKTILDGYPRTLEQVKSLESICRDSGEELKGLIFLSVPDDKIIKRLSGRRVCLKCGEVYHTETKPTKKDSVCDLCGGEVVQRKDDFPGVILKRLDVYRENTEPLISYFKEKNLFHEIDGQGSSEDVFKRVEQIVS